MKNRIQFLILIIFLSSCGGNTIKTTPGTTKSTSDISAYKGTASITVGLATTTKENIFKCERGRKTDEGEITSSDGKKWIVPAKTNFQNEAFPFAPDLHNSCNGNTYIYDNWFNPGTESFRCPTGTQISVDDSRWCYWVYLGGRYMCSFELATIKNKICE